MHVFGLLLSSYLQLGMLTGMAYIPTESLYDRAYLKLPPAYIRIYVEGTKELGQVDITTFGSTEASFMVEKWNSCRPFDLAWTIGAKAEYKNIELGLIRECHHPMQTYVIERTSSGSRRLFADSTEGWSTDIYMRINIH